MVPQVWQHTIILYYNWDLLSSGILRSVVWQSFTDVSGQRIGPISRVKKSKAKRITTRWCVTSQKNADFIYIAAEAWILGCVLLVTLNLTSVIETLSFNKVTSKIWDYILLDIMCFERIIEYYKRQLRHIQCTCYNSNGLLGNSVVK
jgi:hypothetical protein